MKIYKYHPVNKVFVGESEARPDPLEKGSFLIPANSTTEYPLSCAKNEECFFNGGWKIRKIRTEKPSKYHTWTDDFGWSITSDDQALLDSDIASREYNALEAAKVKLVKTNEIKNNPLSNITFKQAETWIDSNVTDLASAKEAMKKIVRLILAIK